MGKNRLIFYVVFGLFHLSIFLFSLYVDSHQDNIQFLIAMQKRIWLLKYGSFFGLSLLIADAIWHLKEERDHIKEKDKVQKELTALKAKLFDLQEEAKQPVRRETEEGQQ